MGDQPEKSGSCLCTAVRYRVNGPLRPVVMCHCIQCRKQTGHVMAATAVSRDDLDIEDTEALGWYRSSDSAERGFCRVCGSTLFWRGDGRDYIAIAAGSLDGDTGLTLHGHVYCEFKGDYYDITGGEFEHPRGSGGTFSLD